MGTEELPSGVASVRAVGEWDFVLESDLHEQSVLGPQLSVARIGEWTEIQRLVVSGTDDPNCPSDDQFRLVSNVRLHADELSSDGGELVVTLEPLGDRQHFRAEAWESQHEFEPSSRLEQTISDRARGDFGADASRIQSWVVGDGVGIAVDSGMTHSLSALAEAEGTVSFLVELGPARMP